MNSVTSAQNLPTASSKVPMPPPHGGHHLILSTSAFMPPCIPPPCGGERLIFSSPNHISSACVKEQLIIRSGAHSTQAPHIAPSASSVVIPPRLQELRPIERPTQLIKDYEKRLRAITQFPPNISDSFIRDSISRFEYHLTAVIATNEKVCGSCRNFIEKNVFRLSKDEPLLEPFFIRHGLPLKLDSCALINDEYQF